MGVRLAVRTAVLASGLLFVPLGAWTLQARPQEPHQITITARKYQFEPARVEVKTGETVVITLVSKDGHHGFSCKNLQLHSHTFTEDEPEKITFTAGPPGTYEFKCGHVCGTGHHKMKGQIVVRP
jgi:cytochrome c oxidase subunit II